MQTTPEAATVPAPGRYVIDLRQSAVTFRTRHLFGLGAVRGDLAVRAGTADVADPVTGSDLHVEIDATSFETGNAQRDAAVRSERFLDTGRYPVMTFRAGGTDGTTLAGTLTVRDVARPVTLTIERADVSPSSFTVHATTRVDRTEFGVTAARGLAARHLDISVRARFAREG